MNKLLSLLVSCAIGSAAAQVPVMTNVPASGAPAISGDLIAFPAAKVIFFSGGGSDIIHTLRYYSISTGVTVDTDKRLAVNDQFNAVVSPSISGSVIAYGAPGANYNGSRIRHFNVTNGASLEFRVGAFGGVLAGSRGQGRAKPGAANP